MAKDKKQVKAIVVTQQGKPASAGTLAKVTYTDGSSIEPRDRILFACEFPAGENVSAEDSEKYLARLGWTPNVPSGVVESLITSAADAFAKDKKIGAALFSQLIVLVTRGNNFSEERGKLVNKIAATKDAALLAEFKTAFDAENARRGGWDSKTSAASAASAVEF